MSRIWVTLFVFLATLFASALLLFMVQPMFSKWLLPLFGSTPAVWNAAMFFFQTVLLLGYGYVHLLKRLPVRKQMMIHLPLLIVALATLPLERPDTPPPSDGNPVWWLLWLLLSGVGLPFFMLSTTAPLLQSWFSESDHPQAKDPYFLYAASNVGSMVGLFAYPLIVERAFRLSEQSELRSFGYGMFVLGVFAAGTYAWKSRVPERVMPEQSIEQLQLGRWILYAAIPSGLLLAVTTYLTVDITPLPLLWVIPLGLYLLTFVIVFSRMWTERHYRLCQTVLVPLLLLSLFASVYPSKAPLFTLLFLHLCTFFLATLTLHGRLALDRPEAGHLTIFYLCLSIGGAMGGAINALLAPVLFEGLWEYPLFLTLVAAVLVGRRRRRDWEILAIGLGVVSVLYLIRTSANADLLVVGAGIVLLFWAVAYRNQPSRVAALMISVFFLSLIPIQADILRRERSFFGVNTISSRAGAHLLKHGTTVHGVQWRDKRKTIPHAYYHPSGPFGVLHRALQPSQGAVLGLGTGAISCYSGSWTFYEVDPDVIDMARNPSLFSYLKECGPVQTVLGDARLELAKTQNRYDLLVLDAFSSDAIPQHLLTREALSLYQKRLNEGGVIAWHVSNRYLDLRPVIGRLAQEAGLQCAWSAQLDESRIPDGAFPSMWMVTSRDPLPLSWKPCPVGDDVWTDDYSNILGPLLAGQDG